MRIFLDANILITVVNNEYPRFTFCSRLLSLTDNSKFSVYTSPLCLSIAFYYAEKKNGNSLAKRKINILAEKLKYTTVGKDTVMRAAGNKMINDFEDGLEYYSAVDSNCKCIVTEDIEDFYFSEIEVLNAHDFLMKYAVK